MTTEPLRTHQISHFPRADHRGFGGVNLLGGQQVPITLLPKDCESHISPIGLTVWNGFLTITGDWSVQSVISNDPTLSGLHVVWQTWFLSTTVSISFQLSNAVLWRLGN